jgi:hypothetical protein
MLSGELVDADYSSSSLVFLDVIRVSSAEYCPSPPPPPV